MNEIKILPSEKWNPGDQGFFKLNEYAYRQADGVSQSMLKQVLRSPACVAQSKRFPLEPTWPMQLGTLAHAAILEPETFDKSFYVQPETYESEKDGVKPWNANSNVCKEWVKKHADRPNLSKAEFQSILDMTAQFEADELGSMFLKKGSGEVAIFHRDEETGIMLKGKLDLFAFSPRECLIGDLKIMGQADEFAFAQQCGELNLHLQADFYISLVREELRRQGCQVPSIRFLHCTILSVRPHFVEWPELDQEALYEGKKLWKQAVADWVRANETGNFAMIRKTSLPKWKLARDA